MWVWVWRPREPYLNVHTYSMFEWHGVDILLACTLTFPKNEAVESYTWFYGSITGVSLSQPNYGICTHTHKHVRACAQRAVYI